MIEGLSTGITILLGLITLGGVVASWVRWGLLRARQRRHRRESLNELLYGRPEIPRNRITGADPQPAVAPLGEQFAQFRKQLTEVHHELHPNGGMSMKDTLGRVEADVRALKDQVAGELSVQNDALANAASASREAITTIHDAIRADPPPDLD